MSIDLLQVEPLEGVVVISKDLLKKKDIKVFVKLLLELRYTSHTVCVHRHSIHAFIHALAHKG